MYGQQVLDIAIRGDNRHLAAVETDDALIRRIAGGDKVAMQVLFTRHHVRVGRFVLRLVRNHALAEDVVNGTFFDVWRQAGKFNSESAVSTWLLAIARFKALSELRRRSNKKPDGETALVEEDPADDPEVAILKKNKSEILRQCLKMLSLDHQEMIDLIYYHEKSIDEVAEIVRIPRNTVKTRAYYARQRLSQLLTARGVDMH